MPRPSHSGVAAMTRRDTADACNDLPEDGVPRGVRDRDGLPLDERPQIVGQIDRRWRRRSGEYDDHWFPGLEECPDLSPNDVVLVEESWIARLGGIEPLDRFGDCGVDPLGWRVQSAGRGNEHSHRQFLRAAHYRTTRAPAWRDGRQALRGAA